jgi:DNA-binding winged helix-turn-helix (wHTH) protein
MATATGQTKDELSFGPFTLLVSERLLTKDGVPVELGARGLDILIALLSKPNAVVSKKELLAQVWLDVVVEEGSLRFHVAGLRKALGDGKGGARYISTLAGRGYCFVAPISRTCGQLQAEEIVAAPFAHTNLPNRLMRMVGRKDDVQRISCQLTATRLATIVGGGGRWRRASSLPPPRFTFWRQVARRCRSKASMSADWTRWLVRRAIRA